MNPEAILKKGLNEIGLSCSQGQINAFMTYLSELKKWNRTYNLTALKTDGDIIIKHFLDSLLYLRAIPSGSFKIADVGSGAGFPGIPLKIVCPEIEITLIEPSWKKSAFLRHIVRVLGLKGIGVLESRLEDIGKTYEKTYDVILSRATFKIKDFLKRACPYIKEGGRLVLSKGPRFSEETKMVDAVEKVLKLELPFIEVGMNRLPAQRNLVVLKC